MHENKPTVFNIAVVKTNTIHSNGSLTKDFQYYGKQELNNYIKIREYSQAQL